MQVIVPALLAGGPADGAQTHVAADFATGVPLVEIEVQVLDRAAVQAPDAAPSSGTALVVPEPVPPMTAHVYRRCSCFGPHDNPAWWVYHWDEERTRRR